MGIGCSFIKIGQWWLFTGYTLYSYIEVQEVNLFVTMNFPWTWDNHENFTGMYTKPTAQTHMLYMYIFIMIMFDYVSTYDR